jgi:FMN-dependent oxidoreductase (nitrilotriacetate monooxygenase family)
MSDTKRQIHLGAFLLGVGHHIAAWRHPAVSPSNALTPSHFVRLAQLAERGKFDAIFFADTLGLPAGSADLLSRTLVPAQFEPVTLLAFLAGATERIGLISTVSATYLPPFQLARKFASLDLISNGRAGWNLVTSATDWEARNFGLDNQIPHNERYKRAHEYVSVVKGLWDSWGDGAYQFGKETGRVFEPEQLHVLDHKGDYFSVRGPLAGPRPVQGYPVIVQAGSSSDGQELAAATAEVVFAALQTLPEAQAFYAGLKAQVAAAGRTPDHVKIMPGVMPIIGATVEEAQEKLALLQGLIDPVVGIGLLAAHTNNVDLTKYPLDGPVPDLPDTEGFQSRQKLFLDLARRENLTLRQLFQRVAIARGHRVVLGTPQSVADDLELWFNSGAADGFNVLAPLLPNGLEEFVDLVIPELQRRGLFRTEYTGTTLREHLGLSRPRNQFE